jgi:acyl CoA:acetate/3-ketoacid CoA transferase beta subunit
MEQLIVRRLLCELKGASKIALGPGIPTRVIPYLNSSQSWIDLSQTGLREQKADVVLVEALEVSETGDLAGPAGLQTLPVDAAIWIATGILRFQADGLQLVKQCTLPTEIEGKVDLIVTEMGVVRVSEIGFELIEISPGVCSDDIRMQVRASLHVADDVKRIQLCA